MGKFSKNLDQTIAENVRVLASEMNLENYVTIEPIALKSKTEIGCVVKGNELVQLFTGDDSLIAVGINEDAFSRVDEQTQELWIRGLLSQIEYDFDKDKVVIKKPEIQIDLGMYRKFGDIAVKKAELAILTLEQIAEDEKKAKEIAKSLKKKKK